MCFHTQMTAQFSKGDFKLPAAHEDGYNVGRFHVRVRGKEGLWLPLSFRITDKHPANKFWRRAWTIPQCCIGNHLQMVIAHAAIPSADLQALP